MNKPQKDEKACDEMCGFEMENENAQNAKCWETFGDDAITAGQQNVNGEQVAVQFRISLTFLNTHCLF